MYIYTICMNPDNGKQGTKYRTQHPKPEPRKQRRVLWVVRVGGDDGELRPWHCICINSIKSRLMMRVKYGDSGAWVHEIRNPRPETRNPKPETQHLTPETRAPLYQGRVMVVHGCLMEPETLHPLPSEPRKPFVGLSACTWKPRPESGLNLG